MSPPSPRSIPSPLDANSLPVRSLTEYHPVRGKQLTRPLPEHHRVPYTDGGIGHRGVFRTSCAINTQFSLQPRQQKRGRILSSTGLGGSVCPSEPLQPHWEGHTMKKAPTPRSMCFVWVSTEQFVIQSPPLPHSSVAYTMQSDGWTPDR